MSLCLSITQLGAADVAHAGGKGASLGEMTQAGIPVPPGFVVLSSAFERFIEETNINVEIDAILRSVSREEMHTVEHASALIQDIILRVPVPQAIADAVMREFNVLDSTYVAVRSSATAEDSASAAWAGQLDSFLNTTEEKLLENVQRCWASLFTPRAIFYRFEKGLQDTKISVAVVVQKMVQSEVSGIAFSVHPVTEDDNQLIIEAGYGLGEAIVSGQITPDSYVVSKSPRKIIDTSSATQTRALYGKDGGGNEWRTITEPEASEQVLDEKQILGLSDIIVRIEEHYGFPCDIEWAYEAGKFYIVQSRPITTLLSSNKIPATKRILTKYLTREHSVFYAHVWNNANRNLMETYVPGTNITAMVFRRTEKGILEVYYDLTELDAIFSRIVAALLAEPALLKDITVSFNQHWNYLAPYIKKETTLKSLADVREFYERWTTWWAAMAYIFVIPDRPELPEEVRAEALRVRESTQEYSDDGDILVTEFIAEHYPEWLPLAGVLTPEEIFSIETLSPETRREIEKRLSGVVLCTTEGESVLVAGDETDSYLVRQGLILTLHQTPSEKYVQGTSAVKGHVTGPVRLVLTKDDLSLVKEGDIMVTYATSPEYVPAMRRCAAIVTDEGGVVCHAAIAARELGIPCIVGTKVATKIFTNDERVQVDADSGVVRIVSEQETKEKAVTFERVFGGPNMPFLVSDLAAEKYVLRYGFFITNIDGVWTCYMPLTEKQRTLQEGKALFSTDKAYAQYRSAYMEFLNGYEQQFQTVLHNSTVITAEDFQAFVELCWKAETFYERTQYFFTDAVVADSDFEKDFSALKIKGRSLLNDQYFSEKNYLEQILQRVAEATKISLADLYFYKWTEIRDLLKGEKVDLPNQLERSTFVTYLQNQKKVTLVGAAAHAKIMQFQDANRQHSSVLSGTIANKGKVIGRVRIFDQGYEHKNLSVFLDKMKTGEILVAETTSPEIMLACQKAAAIVTNQGGLMSHAAIVSRELKIPCIVGVEGATTALKDGDLIEVDADNGVVRKVDSTS